MKKVLKTLPLTYFDTYNTIAHANLKIVSFQVSYILYITCCLMKSVESVILMKPGPDSCIFAITGEGGTAFNTV